MVIETTVTRMDAILNFILTHLSFLYKEFKFVFVDSLVSDSFGGDAYLVLSSENLKLRFVSDRDQLFLEFQSKIAEGKNSWHSIDVIKQLTTNEICDNAILDENHARFLKAKFPEIYRLFFSENAKETIIKLKKLEKERAKRMFAKLNSGH